MGNVEKDYVILQKHGVKAGCIDLLENNKQIRKSHLIKIDNSTFTLLCFDIFQCAVIQ